MIFCFADGTIINNHDELQRTTPLAFGDMQTNPWHVTSVAEKTRFGITETDDRRAIYQRTLEESANGGGEEERRFDGRVPFGEEETSAKQEETSSWLSSSTARPPNDKDYYERQQQQAPMKCQLLDSGIAGVSDAAFADEAENGGVGHGELESATTKNCFTESSLNDGFFNGAKGHRIITATAPPHLRSYYSQENIYSSNFKKESSFNGDNSSQFRQPEIMDENVGIENRLKSFWSTINKKPTSTGALDNVTPSTSAQYTSMSNVYVPRARFDNVGDIENSNLNSNPIFRGHPSDNRPPPPSYNEVIASDAYRLSRPPDAGTGPGANGQEKPVGQAPTIITGGQAPMFITGANRDRGDAIISAPYGFDLRARRRSENRRQAEVAKEDWLMSGVPRFHSSAPARPTTLTESTTTAPSNRPTFYLDPENGSGTSASSPQPDVSSGQSIPRVFSMGNMQNLSSQLASASNWPSTPCFSNAPSGLSQFTFGQPPISAGTYSVTTSTVTMPTSIHSTQSSRVSSYVNPLPEIRENVAVISLPATPTTSEPSPYLLPSIVSDRRSSWFSSPWTSVQTGAVSRLVKAVSCDSAAVSGFDGSSEDSRRSPKDIDYLANLHRVTKLAEYFEKGDIDHVGPLKLYHAQIYKRELEKICSENFGSVLTKAQCFENGLLLPPRPPPMALEVKDAGSYQRASFSSSSVSDDIWFKAGYGTPSKFSQISVQRFSGSNASKIQGTFFLCFDSLFDAEN